ncbi:MAG: glycolate oxidase subunit GlcE [Alphaproteobacteria bacterium]|nr:glycolate oxidase subunit GlcE [Alphaproteobacteria bacterium]
MATLLKPETVDHVRDAVAWAAAEETPLELVGGGSKRSMGRPGNAAHTLDMSSFSGISLYEAEELVLSAGAGTPIADIHAALEEQKQELAFEPPDYGPLLGGAEGAGTLGGVLSANLAGPRRIKAGAARDHFLGFFAVSGRGELFKSGGRVVKNVTGYDLCKVMAGSWGTLGAMMQVTVKVLPAAEKLRTVLIFGSDAAQGVAALTKALQTPYEVSAAAWIPLAISGRSGVGYVRESRASVAAVRVEGPGPSVEYRCATLRRQLADFGETEELHGHNSANFWREIRDVRPFADPNDASVVWKLSVPPQSGARLATELVAALGGEFYLDWGGGLIWLAVPAADAGGHESVRAAIAGAGGHATLIRAPAELRSAVPVFQPQDPGLARLSQRLKEGFDPRGVLNPGRMYPGI